MTDRLNALLVILDHDIREDDAQVIIDAIRLIRGVLDVKPNISDPNVSIATSRAKMELRTKIFDLLKD